MSQWFVGVDGKAFGPYTDLQLLELARSGQVNRETLVSQDGNSWSQAGVYPVLFPVENASGWTRWQIAFLGGAGMAFVGAIIWMVLVYTTDHKQVALPLEQPAAAMPSTTRDHVEPKGASNPTLPVVQKEEPPEIPLPKEEPPKQASEPPVDAPPVELPLEEPEKPMVEIPKAALVAVPDIIFPAIQKYKHDGEVKSEYDKFDKRTTVSTEWSRRYRISEAELMWTAYFTHSDAVVFDSVTFIFMRFGVNWKYLRFNRVDMLADGDKLKIKDSKLFDSRVKNGGVEEYVTVDISMESFSKIVNAKTVDVRIGVDEFSFSEETLELLRDLASRIPVGKTHTGMRIARP